jgi:hypothetical protein
MIIIEEVGKDILHTSSIEEIINTALFSNV